MSFEDLILFLTLIFLAVVVGLLWRVLRVNKRARRPLAKPPREQSEGDPQ